MYRIYSNSVCTAKASYMSKICPCLGSDFTANILQTLLSSMFIDMGETKAWLSLKISIKYVFQYLDGIYRMHRIAYIYNQTQKALCFFPLVASSWICTQVTLIIISFLSLVPVRAQLPIRQALLKATDAKIQLSVLHMVVQVQCSASEQLLTLQQVKLKNCRNPLIACKLLLQVFDSASASHLLSHRIHQSLRH